MVLYGLPEEKRSVEELVQLSERLTSRHLDPEAGLAPARLENLTNHFSPPAYSVQPAR